eukprot:NODE_4134_length_707_cov_146.173313.p4 GENE.NODE_4134_length_707_cov_146.173313~~NODE_4134_length_707_cov_146.173313.p4  ORF type:complete len:58 (+),score=3.64 NODE_4134_length_707_cov_146.173313:484-657(+)
MASHTGLVLSTGMTATCAAVLRYTVGGVCACPAVSGTVPRVGVVAICGCVVGRATAN